MEIRDRQYNIIIYYTCFTCIGLPAYGTDVVSIVISSLSLLVLGTVYAQLDDCITSQYSAVMLTPNDAIRVTEVYTQTYMEYRP